MLIPAKYQGDIDALRFGHRGWHGVRHRLAWAVAPDCIRALMIAGLMVANHPDEVMNALFEKSLTEYADQAAAAESEADEEAHQ
jgi:hypothetical protein|nr:MAG TPA: hypothetical protein [Caudoviricetes sp.]